MTAVSDDEMPQQVASATYSIEGEDFSDDDEEEEEPWDQRRTDSASVGSSTILAAQIHERQQREQQQLRDGELPTLTPVVPSSQQRQPTMMPKTTTTTTTTTAEQQEQQRQQKRPRAGWLLRSGQTSRRPLQPPSLAGLTDDDGGPTLGSNKLISPTESERGRQHQFWSQLDTDPTDDDGGGGGGEEDDGPDDELAARRSEDEDSGRGEGAGVDRAWNNKDQDNASTAEETIEYSQDGAAAQRGANTGVDFCGDTLNALNEMCGTGLEQTHSTEPADAENPPDIKPRNRVPPKSDDQEEYTAIEVEFVESNAPSSGGKESRSSGGPPGRKKGFLSAFSFSPPVSPGGGGDGRGGRETPNTTTIKSVPQQKKEMPPPKGADQTSAESDDAENREEEGEGEDPDVTAKRSAFLSALARKAKAEFDKSKGGKQKVEQHQGADSKSSGETPLDDDVYSTFTAPEKRKFLKLINTGHLPVDATREILDARATKEKKEQATNRKSKRSKRLAFWKKNRASSTANQASSSNRSMDDADDPAYDERDGESESEQELAVQAEHTSPVIPHAAMSAMIALERKAPRPGSPPPPPPPLEEMGDAMSPRLNETEEERFARSGINYYDAIRRETSDTDDEVAQAEVARQIAERKKTPRRIRPRGFSALRDGVRSQSVPRSGRTPESVSEDEPVHFSTNTPTLESLRMDSSKVEVAPTNYSLGKKVQNKGRGIDGGDVFEGTGDEDGTTSLKIRALVSPLRGSQKDSTPRSSRTKPLAGQGDREEMWTPKQGGHKNSSTGGTSTPKSTRRTVADVAHTKKIGREDEEMLARIEKEILLNTAAQKETPESSPKTKPMVMLPITKKSPPRARSASTPKIKATGKSEIPLSEDEQNEFKLELDVDLETYMYSADVYSTAAQDRDTPQSDGRSVYTAATTASVYTQSSRRRRPGAARTRLAKAKEVLQKQAAKKKGWHDSIQAAAAVTNRVWKPGTGWVDYVDTSEDAIPPKSDEKLQVNLKKALTD